MPLEQAVKVKNVLRARKAKRHCHVAKLRCATLPNDLIALTSELL